MEAEKKRKKEEVEIIDFDADQKYNNPKFPNGKVLSIPGGDLLT